MMDTETRKEIEKYLRLTTKEKLDYIAEFGEEIAETLEKKNTDTQQFIRKVSLYKSLLSQLERFVGPHKKYYFDVLVSTLKQLWSAVERCTSQRLLYPALSAFAETYAKFKGLNPYYNLQAVIEGTIQYAPKINKKDIMEMLEKERNQFQFLIDYIQLDSVFRFVKDENERLQLTKSALNYLQLLVLAIYNFLITVPIISREQLLKWWKLIDSAIERTIQVHQVLKEVEGDGIGLLRAKLSESTMFALRAQSKILKARYLNEDVEKTLNQASLETAIALNELEPYLSHHQFSEMVKRYYYQHKAILLEIRFYKILHELVTTQYKETKFVGDQREEKSIWRREVRLNEIKEILREVQIYTNELLEDFQKAKSIGITMQLIDIYAKIAFGAYAYNIIHEVPEMEKIIRTKRLNISDPDITLMLANYWLLKWASEGEKRYLDNCIYYHERAAEIFVLLFNNYRVPIYCFSMLAVLSLYQNDLNKAELYLIRADDAYNEAKAQEILRESEEYFYEEFRKQIDEFMANGRIDKPLRFVKPFNVLDFNTYLSDKRDWRRNISMLPEPFPFHLDQLKIMEFEFVIGDNN